MSKRSKKERQEAEIIQEKEQEEALKLKDRIKELEKLKSSGKNEEMYKLVLSIVRIYNKRPART